VLSGKIRFFYDKMKKPYEIEFKIDFNESFEGSLLHTLAAKCAIRELQDGNSEIKDESTIKRRIVDKSIENNILSVYTSFLAVSEKRLLKKYNILIKFEDTEIKVESIKEDLMIIDLKKIIFNLKGIPIEEQNLSFNFVKLENYLILF
jgi:hypothetical protein